MHLFTELCYFSRNAHFWQVDLYNVFSALSGSVLVDSCSRSGSKDGRVLAPFLSTNCKKGLDFYINQLYLANAVMSTAMDNFCYQWNIISFSSKGVLTTTLRHLLCEIFILLIKILYRKDGCTQKNGRSWAPVNFMKQALKFSRCCTWSPDHIFNLIQVCGGCRNGVLHLNTCAGKHFTWSPSNKFEIVG